LSSAHTSFSTGRVHQAQEALLSFILFHRFPVPSRMNFYAVQRSQGQITVILTESNPAPPLPYELQGHMTNDTWSHRVDAITQCCYKYSRPTLERIWFGLAILVMFIVPMVVNQVVFRHYYESLGPQQQLYETRWIIFGIFFGTAVVFWFPLIAWKAFGSRQVNKLLQEWQKLDRIAQPNTFLPNWKVHTPGIFRSQGTLKITTPPLPAMTSFHPNAPLPPYINAPGYTPAEGPPSLGYALNEKTAFEEINMKSEH